MLHVADYFAENLILENNIDKRNCICSAEDLINQLYKSYLRIWYIPYSILNGISHLRTAINAVCLMISKC